VQLRLKALNLKAREKDVPKTKELIKELCNVRTFKLLELAVVINKGDNYISRRYIKPMLKSHELKYLYPEMIRHPEQDI